MTLRILTACKGKNYELKGNFRKSNKLLSLLAFLLNTNDATSQKTSMFLILILSSSYPVIRCFFFFNLCMAI